MGKDKQMNKELEHHNCREYFRYKTVIRIDKNILEEGREKQREEAVRLTKIWYQKAMELGDTELEKYFYQKFLENSSDCQGKNQRYGKLKRDYFSVIEKQIQKEQIQNIFFLEHLSLNSDKNNYDVSAEGDGTVRLWVEKNREGYDLYISGEGGIRAPQDCSGLFGGFGNVKQIAFGKSFNTENVKNMCGMFSGCQSLEKLDVSNFNTEKVLDMSSMFEGCRKLKELDLRHFNTENLVDMSGMFWDCEQLEKLNMSNFNTENVKDMSIMFFRCLRLGELDVRNFCTGNVKNMSGMFGDCEQLEKLNMNRFNTESVEDMSYMLSGCKCLRELDLYNFDTGNVKDMSSMFYDCEQLEQLNIKNFNTENVEDMSDMFNGCKRLRGLDLYNFDTGNVEDMSGMFYDCEQLEQLNIKKFNTENVEDMSDMFSGCRCLKELDLHNFDTGNVRSMHNMFSWCIQLKVLNTEKFDVEWVKDISEIFFGCECLEKVQGVRVLERLSDEKNAQAMYLLGVYYEGGGETEVDISKAMEYYKEAAEAGFVKACLHLGDCYFWGKGVKKNRESALKWWEEAALNGNSEAAIKAAKERMKDNYAYALIQAEALADTAYRIGDSEAVLLLAEINTRLGNGTGPTKKAEREQYYQKADQFYKEAEQKDLQYASAERAFYYITKVYEPDKKKGIQILETCAAKKDALAQYYLGLCYMTGDGVKKNKLYGESLIRLAAEQGIEQAKRKLGKW